MSYQTDLTIEQFNLIEDLFPKKKITKRKKYTTHQIFNAILYVLTTGCQWRMMPNDLPNWKTVHHYFLTWSKLEVFDFMLKKSLKNSDYNKVRKHIQLYYSQIHSPPKTPIYREKKKQDLMEVKKSKE